jgi:hypothetical protein
MALASFSRYAILGLTICVLGVWLVSPAVADGECPAGDVCIALSTVQHGYGMSDDYLETNSCNITATFANNTDNHIRYFHAFVYDSPIELHDLSTNLNYDISFTINSPSCLKAISAFMSSSFIIDRCSMEGVSEGECKRMVHRSNDNISPSQVRETDTKAADAAAVARTKACHDVSYNNAYYTSRLSHCLGTCPSSSRNLTDDCGAACYAANNDISIEAARNIVAWCM